MPVSLVLSLFLTAGIRLQVVFFLLSFLNTLISPCLSKFLSIAELQGLG